MLTDNQLLNIINFQITPEFTQNPIEILENRKIEKENKINKLNDINKKFENSNLNIDHLQTLGIIQKIIEDLNKNKKEFLDINNLENKFKFKKNKTENFRQKLKNLKENNLQQWDTILIFVNRFMKNLFKEYLSSEVK